MSAVRAGEVDVVVVDELSRLTRKGAHDALEIDNDFKRYGVRFVSVLEPFLDTSNAIGVAIFALIAVLAKQDSDIKAERLRGVSARMPTTTSLDEYGHGLPPRTWTTARTGNGWLRRHSASRRSGICPDSRNRGARRPRVLSTSGTPSPNHRPTARPVFTEAATNWPCGGRR